MARDEIQKRIAKYAASEIKFSLLAIIKDKQDQAEEELTKLNLIQAYLKGQTGEEQLSEEKNAEIQASIGTEVADVYSK